MGNVPISANCAQLVVSSQGFHDTVVDGEGETDGDKEREGDVEGDFDGDIDRDKEGEVD